MSQRFTKANVETFPIKDSNYEVYDSKVTGLFIRVYAAGRRKYIVEYARKKKQTLGTVGIMTLDAAREKAAELIRIAKANGGVLVDTLEAESLTLGDFIKNHYTKWMTLHMKNHEKDLSTINRFFSPLMTHKLDQLTYLQFDELRSDWLEDGNSRATVNRKMNSIRGLFKRALEWKLLAASPIANMKNLSTDDEVRPRYLSADEELSLFQKLDEREAMIRAKRESANTWRSERDAPLLPSLHNRIYTDHLKPIIITQLKTGMRRGELFDLKWKDVCFKEMTIRVSKTKTRRGRMIPIHRNLAKTLKEWCPHPNLDDYVFPSPMGGRLTDIKTSFNNILEAAKIENFRFHDLRHTFASNLVMRGVALNTVRDLLGHQSIKMTLRYAHLSPATMADAINTL